MKDIAVSVVCYNNEDEVINFAESLSKQSIINHIQLIISYNMSSNPNYLKERILSILPETIICAPPSNMGYLHGCLFGVNQTQNNFQWILISNTDIEFQQIDFFEHLLNGLPNDTWCIGPKIVLADSGLDQNPFLIERPSQLKVLIWSIVYSNYYLFRFYFMLNSLRKKNDSKFNASGVVYSVHGSCFLINKELLESLNSEQSKVFMYGEELLLSEIVRENNKKVFYNSSAKIIHNENQVTHKIDYKRKQEWFHASMVYLCERFFRRKKSNC